MTSTIKDWERLRSSLENVMKASEDLALQSLRVAADFKKMKPPEIQLTGLVKAYMDAVKKSDGLTSVRPTTLKAVQTAEKTPSPASVTQASAEIQRHLADVKKASGTDKKFANFDKAISGLLASIKKLV